MQTRPRNETLDCFKYALAALRLAGIDLRARATTSPEKTTEPKSDKPAFVQKQTRPGGFVKGWK